jgi:hypothetical protein
VVLLPGPWADATYGAASERIDMASTVSVTVPTERGDEVLSRLLARYAAEADSLRAATMAYLEDRRSLDPVLTHRDELMELDALAELVGWRFGPKTAAVELVGPPPLVRELLRETLMDAAAAFARDLERYEQGAAEFETLRAAARATYRLFGEFARFEAATV